MTRPRLLILDDDVDIAALVARVAEREGFDVESTTDFATFDRAATAGVEVIVLDLMMPGVDGIEVIRHLGERNITAQVILASGCELNLLYAAGRLVAAQGLTLAGCISKPFKRHKLETLLRKTREPQSVGVAAVSTLGEPVIIDTPIDPTELRVLFQPKIDVATLDFVSVEALLRWKHPQHGLLTPDYFLAHAEASGAIDELTWTVVQKTFAQCTEWAAQGLNLKVAINVSGRSLNNLDTPDIILDAARSNDVYPHQVVLEITESWLNQDPIAALDTLTRLRLKGFELSIDDFGTGYSSMQQLNMVPFSEMKLDQSFIRLAPINEEARAIIQSSIELGHRLNMRVVAEGVESGAEWDLISSMGCDECQGYLIAKPMPGDEAPDWLKRWNRLLGRNSTYGTEIGPAGMIS